MQFRCPNCQHAIKVEDSGFTHEDETVSGIECPSCHSHFNLSSDEETTISTDKGAKIGHFVVQTVLGEGSFGTVYKAHDPELNRTVAIKVPRVGRVSSKTSKLFLREAQSAARVKHTNVVSVFEVGHHEEQYYIASEYIDGISLSEYLKDHSFSPKDSAKLLIKVLRGVDSFHNEGIIHRDLKPANILLDIDLEPHITDFGLARHETENAITVTQDGDIFGTPVYMPPEQARGDVHQIDHRSDIYAVGVIQYQLLTGEKPFKASSSRTLLYSIQNDDPTRPRLVDKRIPRDLETICQKAIEKDSALRYQSAAAMADDLQRWLDGHPIWAKPVSRWKKISKWVLRHIALTVAITVAFCSLIVATILLTNQPPIVPDNMTPVVIQTEPPADWIRFLRYNEISRRPHSNQFEAVTASDQLTYLQPGFYKVLAGTDDGNFHEVWRTVPDFDDSAALSEIVRIPTKFPHLQSWRQQSGNIQLPTFRLFRERDIEDPVVLQPGGTFEMGTDKNPNAMSPKHQQTVEDFYVGLHEVSYGRFRAVMQTERPQFGSKTTWMDFLNARFGNRDDIAANLPVTGYPRDVAILYCELVGGRLPTHVEYEYLATERGVSKYPTGDEAAIDDVQNWQLIPVAQPTSDQTLSGIQNLYSSAAEYTDSSLLSYSLLYPDLLPENPYFAAAMSMFEGEMGTQMKNQAEARGASKSWVLKGTTTTADSPRSRIPLQQVVLFKTNSRRPLDDEQLAAHDDRRDAMKRTGWRVYRSSIDALQKP